MDNKMLLKLLWTFISMATDVAPQELFPNPAWTISSILACVILTSSETWSQTMERQALRTEQDCDGFYQESWTMRLYKILYAAIWCSRESVPNTACLISSLARHTVKRFECKVLLARRINLRIMEILAVISHFCVPSYRSLTSLPEVVNSTCFLLHSVTIDIIKSCSTVLAHENKLCYRLPGVSCCCEFQRADNLTQI